MIAFSKMYRSSSTKSSRVSRGEVRERSEGRQRDKSERECFRCGAPNHLRARCNAKVYCDMCKSDNLSNKTCWHTGKEKVNKTVRKEESKITRRKKSKVNQAASEKVASLSSSDKEEYDSHTDSKD